MRFTQKNWDKFFDGTNKQTTFRLKKHKIGHHKAYSGSYFNPILLGEFDIVKVEDKIFEKLNLQDAIDDGFDSVGNLMKELESLNKQLIEPRQILYKHWVENPKKAIR